MWPWHDLRSRRVRCLGLPKARRELLPRPRREELFGKRPHLNGRSDMHEQYLRSHGWCRRVQGCVWSDANSMRRQWSANVRRDGRLWAHDGLSCCNTTLR